jgi:hypothetical protein
MRRLANGGSRGASVKWDGRDMNVLKLFGIERRKHRRHVVIDTAWVRLADGEPPSVCVLWDMSESGARLTVADPAAIRDECVLMLNRADVAGTRCRVVWRSKDQVGLEFLSSAEPLLRLIKRETVRG